MGEKSSIFDSQAKALAPHITDIIPQLATNSTDTMIYTVLMPALKTQK
jgi:malate/lactate dehydrogenase